MKPELLLMIQLSPSLRRLCFPAMCLGPQCCSHGFGVATVSSWELLPWASACLQGLSFSPSDTWCFAREGKRRRRSRNRNPTSRCVGPAHSLGGNHRHRETFQEDKWMLEGEKPCPKLYLKMSLAISQSALKNQTLTCPPCPDFRPYLGHDGVYHHPHGVKSRGPQQSAEFGAAPGGCQSGYSRDDIGIIRRLYRDCIGMISRDRS